VEAMWEKYVLSRTGGKIAGLRRRGVSLPALGASAAEVERPKMVLNDVDKALSGRH